MASDVRIKLVTRILISLVILASGLWVILAGGYSAETIAWAAGIVGVVVGYWLK